MKVLVVGSSEASREALAAPLRRAGMTPVFASGGQEALEQIASDPPDALVVEAQGAAADGVQLLKRLRGSDAPQHLPVMLLFSEDEDAAERLRALRLGADDVLVKPFEEDELTARVERSVALKQRMDALVDQGRKLELLSVTDGLTQIHNHRFFRERLQEEFRRFQRYQDALGLIFVDLDHFKDVNDVYGHLVGDEVLKTVAQAIRQCLRDVDVLARYGGEEFAVLLPQTHLSGTLTAAERIRRDIQALRLGEDGALRITASLGVATLPNPALATADALVGAADAALYSAKHEGRNRIQVAPAFAPGPGASHLTASPRTS